MRRKLDDIQVGGRLPRSFRAGSEEPPSTVHAACTLPKRLCSLGAAGTCGKASPCGAASDVSVRGGWNTYTAAFACPPSAAAGHAFRQPQRQPQPQPQGRCCCGRGGKLGRPCNAMQPLRARPRHAMRQLGSMYHAPAACTYQRARLELAGATLLARACTSAAVDKAAALLLMPPPLPPPPAPPTCAARRAVGQPRSGPPRLPQPRSGPPRLPQPCPCQLGRRAAVHSGAAGVPAAVGQGGPAGGARQPLAPPCRHDDCLQTAAAAGGGGGTTVRMDGMHATASRACWSPPHTFRPSCCRAPAPSRPPAGRRAASP